MSEYIVSARKYRPDTFDTVVGQEHITTTLKNAIKGEHLSHAFLFCGPRGVGKTTCARILARTINCLEPTADTEACGKCESCTSFNSNASYNIFELDAASNNSVDDIRKLTDNVRIPPQVGKYKVYIIDEVHMLSSQAFNAFLKTLEEPPTYAKFILATTEKNKILPTILSRCQIFDFKRISVDDIATHLEKIAIQEHVNYDSEALRIIAMKADGGLRDALSMFDQLVSFANNNLSYKNVIDNLNILDFETYFKIIESVIIGDISSVLRTFNDVIDNGFDGGTFINGLSKHLRDLLVSRDTQTLTLLNFSETTKNKYVEQTKKCSLKFLVDALNIANTCDAEYKNTSNKHLSVELALLNMTKFFFTLTDQKSEKNDTNTNNQSIPISISTPPTTQPVTPITTQVPATSTASPTVSTDKIAQPEKKSTSVEVDTSAENKLKSKDSLFSVSSISNIIKEKTDNNKPETTIERNNQIDYENLKQTVAEYCDTITDMTLKAVLHRAGITLTENNIVFSVGENIHKDILHKNIPALLSFLDKKLSNNKLQIDISVDENITAPIAYTPVEKFQEMVKKNPDLMVLKTTFNAEIGY